jgi:hypothetical protein
MRPVTPEKSVRPFDEKAALAELERLRDSIQAARQARQRASDEFDAFVKSFRTPASTRTSEHPASTSRASPAAQQAASESIGHPVQSPDPFLSTVTVPSNTNEFDDRTAAPSSQLPRRYHLNIRTLGIVAIIAVIALGLLSTRRSRQMLPPTHVSAVTDNAASTRNAAPPTAAASQSAASAAAARGVVLELRIVRPVWMRVVIDGRKDVEGMVQGGQPLRFTGDHSIIVRVGNGGDVLVTTGNGEESFGDAGQPLTRTFSKR